MTPITFDQVINLTLSVCIAGLLISIAADFAFYNKAGNVKKSRKSVVATGTMFAFFLFYYAAVMLRIGELQLSDAMTQKILSVIGAAMVVAGTLINILGRLQLKANWSNHIKIYASQELIRTGVYGIVRHPLYASLMLMFFGGVLVFRNVACFVLTLFVFIPFMYFRASQEEGMLEKEFPQYHDYKCKTGMFFPKLWRR